MNQNKNSKKLAYLTVKKNIMKIIMFVVLLNRIRQLLQSSTLNPLTGT